MMVYCSLILAAIVAIFPASLMGSSIDEDRLAKKWVSAVKEAARAEGRFAQVNVGNRKFSMGCRIANLAYLKSPVGVAGLIEIMLDPGFIEFDRKYGRINDGRYRKLDILDPNVCLMVMTAWKLLNQPLVDEAAIPQVMSDKSKELRLHTAYIMDHDVMVDDCSAWCREVLAGRMTFEMEGDPTRYNRFGKANSNSASLSRLRRSDNGERRESFIIKGDESHLPWWVYAFPGLVIVLGLGAIVKRRLTA